MKYYIFFLLLLCSSINAQTTPAESNLKMDSIFLPKLTGEAFDESKQYVGEQFFNKDWVKGDILLATGLMIHGEKLKYDGLFDELIWLNVYNYRKFKLDKSFINEFWIKNSQDSTSHFKRINLSESDKTIQPDIYAEVGIEGKVSLYIQRKISIKGTETESRKGITYSLDYLKSTPLYYVKLANAHFEKMSKIRRATFLKLFPEQKRNLSKMIKDNHLNIKLEADLIRLIDLINKE